MSGRFYWLKLKRDFFKRHDIRIVESEENGKEYILFYLKLLCESVDHEGNLRFSEEIPYTEEMLSAVTNTDINIVNGALNVFKDLQLIKVLEDETYFMTEVEGMIGSAVDNDNANRQRRYRESQKTQALRNVTPSVTKRNESKSKSKSKSKNKSKNNNNYIVEFEEVWSEYPRKQGKSNALKAYIKARNDGISHSDILNGVHNYLLYIENNKVEDKYIKMGSTWFNQQCWNDDYSLKKKRGRLDWIDEV